MKTPHLLTALALAITCSAAQALAVAFTVGGTSGAAPYDTYWVEGDEPNPAVKFYKNDFSKSEPAGVEEGTYSNEFATAWGALDEDGEPLLATITWISGFNFSLSEIWLKSGQSAWFAFDLSGFNSALFDSIELNHPTGRHAISHIQLVGTVRSVPPSVPDTASTLALLGIGLTSLALIARRRRA